MAGVLNPIMAAAAMVLSSLSVIGNSQRVRGGRSTAGFLPKLKPHPSAADRGAPSSPATSPKNSISTNCAIWSAASKRRFW
jgi:hypothetical protein